MKKLLVLALVLLGVGCASCKKEVAPPVEPAKPVVPVAPVVAPVAPAVVEAPKAVEAPAVEPAK